MGANQQMMMAGSPLSGISFLINLQLQTGNGLLIPGRVWKDTSRTLPATLDGDLVASWYDPVSGLAVEQSTSGKRPILRFGDGVPTLEFDGARSLSIASITYGAFTDFFVFRGVGGMLMEYGNGVTEGGYFFLPNTDLTQVARGGLKTSKTAAAAMTNDAWRVVSRRYNGTNASHLVWVGGASLSLPGNSATANPGTSSVSTAIYIGSRTDTSLFLSGRIESVLISATSLTDTQRQAVENSLTPLIPNPSMQTVVWTASDLNDNGYNGTGLPKFSPMSRLIFTTDSLLLRVRATTTAFALYPQWADLGVKIDGVDQVPVTCFSSGSDFYRVYSMDAGTKTVEVVAGLQASPTGVASGVIGTYIDEVKISSGASYSIVPSNTTSRIVIYSDSIGVGANATRPEYEGWPVLLRTTYSRNTLIEAYGSRALWSDCVNSAARTAFATRLASYSLSQLVIMIGTNDYGLNRWNAANFGIAYADLVDKFNALQPSIPILLISPLQRIPETANSFGDNLQAYRNQISSIAAARPSFCTYLNGGAQALVSDANLAGDGIHPTTAGQAQLAASVDPSL